MGKIFNEEERKKFTKKESVIYSEAYDVLFWISDGEFWKQKTETYYASGKGYGEQIIKKWKKEYKNKGAKLVSVTYQ